MAARDFGIATTAVALSAVWAANRALDSGEGGVAFVTPSGQRRGQVAHHGQALGSISITRASDLGTRGLLAFGMGYGALAALACGASRRPRTSRRAEEIEVAEKTETKPVSYLQNIPRTIMEKRTLDKLLSTVPKEQWENPPEDSYLYTLKMYAETYGPGKATKMGWFDFWYMRIN
eukprot:CAMPEP_0171091778 /NCGR_PEP_ID=MMETSP0766_2-20121228/35317_1 /TAXON_ID=439317 /ORGANISM="Gambierdiscus australes, Strain CAWD 149" /LENGTH=175 /DNA_ID=CAMNT_0011549941 /DNA_START=68 /DNA_END=592 /DNA_ORIENTATION=+